MLIQIKGKDYNEQELAVLAKAGVLDIAEKNDPASTTLTAQVLHGVSHGNANQYGLFSYPGVRPQRFSAMLRPNSWLNAVSVNKSDVLSEILEIQTGQLTDDSTNTTGWCGDAPVPGKLKVCQQVFAFGSFHGKTDLNALPLIGARRNRADVPASLMNSAAIQNPFLPDALRTITDTRSQLSYELYRMGNAIERSTEVVSIRGTAAANNNRYGWWAEFAGLDGQIKTGYADAVTNLLCPAADSIVENFNSTITGNHSDGTGRNITATLFDLFYALRRIADRVGMNGVQWGVVLREELFRTLVEVIANQYNFYNAAGTQYNERNLNADMVQNLRREMMSNGYLLNDAGQPVPVIFSDGLDMPAIANATYNSDILVVPISWNGTPLIRLEYYPMDNQYIQEFASFVEPDSINTINDGMFMVGRAQTPLCLEYHFAARMRLILETPFLAGRVDDLRFTYYAKSRTAIPGSSLYANGGTSYRT